MHYSECYGLIKKLNNKDLARNLKTELENIELKATTQSFISYIKHQMVNKKSIFDLHKDFTLLQLSTVEEGIQDIILRFPCDNDTHLKKIHNVLTDIQKTIRSQKKNDTSYMLECSNFAEFAKVYGTYYLPMTQSDDPFKAPQFKGYCWGHTHRYGDLVSKQNLESLSISSDKKLYELFKDNWSYSDVLFKRISWYSELDSKKKVREAIWYILSQLDEQSIFNVIVKMNPKDYHSTGIRMVGKGIEFYDSNYGLVQFSTRENAVRFLTEYLLSISTQIRRGFMRLWVKMLPYDNVVSYDMFANLDVCSIEHIHEHSEQASKPNSNCIAKAIQRLASYEQLLHGRAHLKAQIKSYELNALVCELQSEPNSEKIKVRLQEILETKHHCLVANRGFGFYFFKSGFKSVSTTQNLLKDIYDLAKQENQNMLIDSLHN